MKPIKMTNLSFKAVLEFVVPQDLGGNIVEQEGPISEVVNSMNIGLGDGTFEKEFADKAFKNIDDTITKLTKLRKLIQLRSEEEYCDYNVGE